jgi:hypothetical protein
MGGNYHFECILMALPTEAEFVNIIRLGDNKNVQ